MSKEKEIGEITHYYGKIGVGVVKLSAELKVGDRIHILGHTTDFEQTVDSIQIEHKRMESAKKGESIGLKVAEHVREGDKVYKIIE
jgi:putative protease